LLAFINLRKNLAAEKRTPWRLRLDELFDMESLYIKGIQSLQLATQPFMETWQTWLFVADGLCKVYEVSHIPSIPSGNLT